MAAQDIAPWLVNMAIVVLLAETACLGLLRRATVRRWLPQVLAGLCLMMALRSAAGAADLAVLGGWLAAAGLAHAWSWRARWQSPLAQHGN